MTLGQRIQSLLDSNSISQAELARRVGVRQSTINGLVNGKSNGTTHLHRIARELCTTSAFLVGETDDPSEDAETPMLSNEEAEILTMYRLLDSHNRDAIRSILKTMADRSTVHAPSRLYLAQRSDA